MSEGSTHIVAKDILNSLGLTLYLMNGHYTVVSIWLAKNWRWL